MSCLVTKLNGVIDDPSGKLKNFKSISGNFYTSRDNFTTFGIHVAAVASASNPFIIKTGSDVTFEDSNRIDAHTFMITDESDHFITMNMANNAKTPQAGNIFIINNKYLIRYFYEDYNTSDPNNSITYLTDKHNVVHFNTASDLYGIKNMNAIQIGQFNDGSFMDATKVRNKGFGENIVGLTTALIWAPFCGDLGKLQCYTPNYLIGIRLTLINDPNHPCYFADPYSAPILQGYNRILINAEYGVPIFPIGTDLSRLKINLLQMQVSFINTTYNAEVFTWSKAVADPTDRIMKLKYVNFATTTDLYNYIKYLSTLSDNTIQNDFWDSSYYLAIKVHNTTLDVNTIPNDAKAAINTCYSRFESLGKGFTFMYSDAYKVGPFN